MRGPSLSNLIWIPAYAGMSAKCERALARARPLGAFDKHPIARAHVRPIVPDRIMLGAAIVPECDRMRRPAETHVPMRPRDMVVKEFQHAAAFSRRHFVNVTGELAIDEQCLAAAFRMTTDDGVNGDWIDIGVLVKAARTVMRCGLALQIRLHRGTQFLVSLVSGGKHRVAAAIGRNDLLVQYAV